MLIGRALSILGEEALREQTVQKEEAKLVLCPIQPLWLLEQLAHKLGNVGKVALRLKKGSVAELDAGQTVVGVGAALTQLDRLAGIVSHVFHDEAFSLPCARVDVEKGCLDWRLAIHERDLHPIAHLLFI